VVFFNLVLELINEYDEEDERIAKSMIMASPLMLLDII